MRTRLIAISSTFLLVGLSACGQKTPSREDRFNQPEDQDLGSPVPACPVDPDCSIGGDACDSYECPDYWSCQDLGGSRKRCLSPGPDYPDGGDWQCEDVAGETICRRSGDLPDDGGGGDWSCEQQGEFVVCTSGNPSYPDDGGAGPWNCWYEGEFRICENPPNGDGGDWNCYETAAGDTQCRHDDPAYPDDREWDCWDADGTTTCQTPGGDLPDDGGGGDWNCEAQGEFVQCTDPSPEYPDEGGDMTWDCRFGDEFRICDRPGPPDDGMGFGPPVNGYPGGGDNTCVPSSQRWCDDDVFCSWGKQTCLPDGTWGRCIEPTVDAMTGLADRPATECGCRYFYFQHDCCEDQNDANGDGVADCIIPPDHEPPACESDGSLCSYCDVHVQCGGANDICIFDRTGYAFCGQDCSATGCPDGYECRNINSPNGTLSQCSPVGTTCN